jgi:hypothetical protein
VLAELALTAPTLGFVRRAVAAVRTWLREHGFSGLRLTDDEIIRSHILPARAFVTGGRGAGAAVAFSRKDGTDQTNTEAFRKWFGDSKVMDTDGRPLVVYHGTPADFDAFDAKKLGANTGHSTAGLGFFFSADPGITGMFTEKLDMTVWPYKSGHIDGANTMPVYLSIKNPKVMTATEFRLMAQVGGRAGNTSGAKMVAADVKALRNPSILQRAFGTNYDGVLIQGDATLADAMGAAEWAADTWVAFQPEQIKSAIGNSGAFDPTNPDIRYSRSNLAATVRQAVVDRIEGLKEPTVKSLNWWHKSVGTQYQKARDNSYFRRTFNAAQSYIDDTAFFANTAADKAPGLLPRLETLGDLKKRLALDPSDEKAVSAAVFTGTLTDQRVYDLAELRSRFGMNDRQIGLYHQFREAVDLSLDQLVAGEVVRFLGTHMDDLPPQLRLMVADGRLAEFERVTKEALQEVRAKADEDLADVRRRIRNEMGSLNRRQKKALEGPGGRAGSRLATLEKFDKERAELKLRQGGELYRAKERFDLWDSMVRDVGGKYEQIEKLKGEGYAPLMRFGQFTVDVVDEEGERVYFGMYESEHDAKVAAKRLAAEFPDTTISRGIVSEEEWRLFKGLSPATMEIFTDLAGLADSDLAQTWIKAATTNRSALRRHLHRQGIAGFSEDVSRTLAAFITSNARATSGGVHLGELEHSIAEIPKRMGDVKDEAVKLRDYVQNPQDEAQTLRGLLFTSFLGGSVASAAINLTQPITMTLPYLSQWGGVAKAGARMAAAVRDALRTPTEPGLVAAMKKASERGIISPQEIHQLQAEVTRNLANTPKMRKLAFAWGAMFSLAEQFNRRSTFIAAYRTAVAENMPDPMAFAERAVEETQGIYSKANRPNWARGAIGATVFTFKQYSISYLEMLARMWNAGAPGSEQRAAGRKAVGVALATLILLAGGNGLPFADDVDDLIDTMGQQFGYATNGKRWRDHLLREVLGDTAAEFAQHGVSSVLPFDVAGRFSMGNLIPATGIMRRDNASSTSEIMEAIGPVGQLAQGSARMAGALLHGDVVGALRASPVTTAKNLAQAGDMLATGAYRDGRGRKVVDASFSDAVFKAIGFQPEAVASEQRSVGMKQQDINLARITESEIASQWAEAVFKKDADGVQAARDRVKAWNEKNPELAIKITAQQIVSRVRQMNIDRSERQMKATPKELRRSLET